MWPKLLNIGILWRELARLGAHFQDFSDTGYRGCRLLMREHTDVPVRIEARCAMRESIRCIRPSEFWRSLRLRRLQRVLNDDRGLAAEASALSARQVCQRFFGRQAQADQNGRSLAVRRGDASDDRRAVTRLASCCLGPTGQTSPQHVRHEIIEELQNLIPFHWNTVVNS
jgi:hypothetical protein